MLKTALLIALLGVVAFRVHFFYEVLDFHKSAEELAPTSNFRSCRHVLSTDSFSANAPSLDLRDIPGYEDIALIDQQTAVSCAGDLHNLWHRSGFQSIGSQCVLIRLARSAEHDGATVVAVEAMTITGFQMYDARQEPKAAGSKADDAEMRKLLSLSQSKQVEKLDDVKLNLHGLTVVKDPRQGSLFYLFGINHAYDRGDERIEAFRIDQERRQLHHMLSLKFDNRTLSLFRGTLNDLAVTDFATQPHGMKMSGSLYVSSWLELGDPLTGRVDGPGTTALFLKRKALMYGRGILGTFNTKVIRCSFDTSELFAQKCEFKKELVVRCDNEYIGGFGIANGVTTVSLSNLANRQNKPVEVVFVADVLVHQIKVFINPPWNAFSGSPFQQIPASAVLPVGVRHAIDNLEAAVDDVTCEPLLTRGAEAGAVERFRCTVSLYSGFIGSLQQASKLDIGLDDTLSPGGLAHHKIRLSVSKLRNDDGFELSSVEQVAESVIVMTDGRFNGLSSGVVLRDGEAAYAVMSSFKEAGLLACPIQE